MGGHIHIKEEDDSQHLRKFPNKNLILTHYMLRAWWLNLLDGMVYHVIRLGKIEQVLLMNTNIMTMFYTYTRRSLKKSPRTISTLIHFERLITCTP